MSGRLPGFQQYWVVKIKYLAQERNTVPPMRLVPATARVKSNTLPASNCGPHKAVEVHYTVASCKIQVLGTRGFISN